ncbi:hypothetical protein AA0474_0955 [Acetobacter lovaniensis NRIC 0474]|nr:hypothetical protein AA0474_0955 [Acetobacter lovaniensis NRIC 0474]
MPTLLALPPLAEAGAILAPEGLPCVSALAEDVADATRPDARIRDGKAAQASRFRLDRQAIARPERERKDRGAESEEG